MRKKYTFLIMLLLLTSCIKEINNDDKEIVNGKYPGETTPSDSAIIFADNFISTEFNERDMTLHPHGDELFYSLRTADGTYSIIQVKKNNGGWQSPQVASFSGIYSDLEPCYSLDGEKLFFVSNRPRNENGDLKDYDIWFVEKKGKFWGIPKNLGAPVNTEANEFYPSFTFDSTIYFCAKREDAIGGEDLFYSELKNGSYQEPINLGDSINTAMDEFNAFIEPSGKYIIFTSTGWGTGYGGGDLWISFRKDNKDWSQPLNMGGKVNSPFFEYCPSLTPDGKYLFFTSNKRIESNIAKDKLTYNKIVEELQTTLNGSQNIYWISTEIINELKN
jgi:Tol biopolymer transport system component